MNKIGWLFWGLTILATQFFTGCSTPYQPRAFRGGTSYHRIDEDTFIVRFSHNELTGKEAEYAYFLQACADVTANNGYDYFVIQDYPDFDLLKKYNYQGMLRAKIKAFKGKVPTEPAAFDAKAILAPMNKKYDRTVWNPVPSL